MKFTPEELKEIQEFIAGNTRFKGMNIREAEQLAWAILYKFRDDSRNFLENFVNDVKLTIDSFTEK